MLKEFKEFALRGNVLDLAIGVIIGAAFGKIVSSLVNDIIMPPIGMLLGQVNFTDLFFTLSSGEFTTLAAAQEAGAVTINYGIFINAIFDFVIIAFVIFMLIRQVNQMQTVEEAPASEPTTKKCPHCFSEIAIQATRCPHCTSQL